MLSSTTITLTSPTAPVRCIEHDKKTGGHAINDNYALQMRNLAKVCEDNKMNSEELSPCCVSKRYHGHNNPVKIELTEIPVKVEYNDRDGRVRSFIYIFLSHKPATATDQMTDNAY